MTINETLNWATKKLKKAKIESPRVDAEILLVHSLQSTVDRKINKIWLYQNPTYQLKPKTHSLFKKFITCRQRGEPLAYITHHKEFFGLDFWVDRNVLIPRPETEILIEAALQQVKSKIKNQKSKITIIDVGTGSGCIIVTLAKIFRDPAFSKLNSNMGKVEPFEIKFYATDISKKALKVAKKNAKIHKVDKKITFLHGDLLKELDGKNLVTKIFNPPSKLQSATIILANLPYLPSQDYLKSPNLRYEPRIALDGKKDGLTLYRRFFKQLSTLINAQCPNIIVLIEIDPSQTNLIKKIIQKYLPNWQITIKKDLSGQNRVVIVSNHHSFLS